jgi:hypothetical protein
MRSERRVIVYIPEQIEEEPVRSRMLTESPYQNLIDHYEEQSKCNSGKYRGDTS